jgi:hypothetical protein
MVNYVIYGHTDYLDVLNIQSDYVNNITKKILFINKNSLDINYIYDKYDCVIYYDDSKTYPQRLSECLKQIDDGYILFCHDIDILLTVNQKIINNIFEFLKYHNFDRVDLKYTPSQESSLVYQCSQNKNFKEWYVTKTISDCDDLFLIKQTNPSNYIYNVNPSIWKKSSLLEIMDNFPYKNYRTIEDLDVQVFSTKYTIFKIHTKHKIECGHFECINDFVFFHITHSGSFVPLNSEYSTIYGQSYLPIKNEYESIVKKYNLINSGKWKF